MVSGIGNEKRKAKHSMKLTICRRFESDFVLTTDAVVLPEVTQVSNNTTVRMDLEFLNNVTLADPSFLRDSEIDLLLSASEY